MIPAVRYLKNADSAVLPEKPIISPGNGSGSGWTPPRILKIKISRDTKLFFDKRRIDENRAESALIRNLSRRFQIARFSR
jgi:hypothetical protein